MLFPFSYSPVIPQCLWKKPTYIYIYIFFFGKKCYFNMHYFLGTLRLRIRGSTRLCFFEKISDSPLLLGPPVYWFSSFFWGKQYFRYEIRNFKEATTGGILKKFSKLKGKHPCFQYTNSFQYRNSVYFSHRVNISFQLIRSVFESEKLVFALLQHFFPFP